MRWLSRGVGIAPIFGIAWLVTMAQFYRAGGNAGWTVLLSLILAASLTVSLLLGFRALFCRLVGAQVPLSCWLSCLTRCVGGAIAAIIGGAYLGGFAAMMMEGSNRVMPFAFGGIGLIGAVCVLRGDIRTVRTCLTAGNGASQRTLLKIGLLP